MTELKFTHQFKLKLVKSLEDYLWDNEINLAVKTDYRLKVGDEEHRSAIVILNPNDANRLIGIELEVISEKDQLFVNYNKFRNWVLASPSRKGGLLHVFTSNANIYQKDIYELLATSYDDVRKDSGFCYEFVYLNIDDYLKYTKTSRTLIEDDWDFNVRLVALIDQVFGRRFLNFV